MKMKLTSIQLGGKCFQLFGPKNISNILVLRFYRFLVNFES
nr:MAG TPA: hypothetical protein [Bacteriophage sp.]